MTMLVPLAVLAVGSVLAGMVWHKQFFGDHYRMTAFFAMPHHAAAAGEAHGAPAAEAVATEAAGETHDAPAADAADDGSHVAATTEAAAEAPAAPAAEAGHAPEGAIYMSDSSNAVLDGAHHAPDWVKVSPVVAMLIGFAVAFQFYIRDPSLPGRVAAANPVLYRFLLNKWYFDEAYDFAIVGPARWLGALLWKRGDGAVIDGTINGVAMGAVPFFTRLAQRAQSGYLFTYAFAMVLGIGVLITWMTLAGGK